jgi:hypothetical protein
MAINYLNSINLNQNELVKAQIENQPNDAAAGTGVEGQLYYDTTLDVLKVWAGGSWVEVGGGVISLTAGTYLTNSGTATDPIINHDNTTRTDSTTVETLTYGGTFTAYTDVTTNATGHITDAEETTFTMPASDDTTYDLTTAPTGTAIRLTDGSNPDDVTISGEGSEVEVTRMSESELRIGLPDDVVITDTLEVGDSFTVGGDAQFNGSVFDIGSNTAIDFGNNKIGQVADPTDAQDAATKQYVDDSNAGQLVYQGGYNANTNVPNLDDTPTITINTGFTWTVTADGLFFTEQVRVGDLIIANVDSPTALADWTTVQNNVDLADLTTVGIGNVNAGTGISVAYSSGTATVTNTDTNTSNTATGTIAIGDLSGTVTHNFGINTIVQTIDSSGNTVYCDVSRTTTTSVATISTAQAGAITILVQKIG